MAFNAKGFKTVTHIGTPDTAGSAGTNRCLHVYVTNEDKAAVETAGFFNPLTAQPGRVKAGDIIMISMNVATAPMLRNYVVTSNSGTVIAIAAQNVA